MTFTHGTASAYVNHRCRCDVCREGNRVRQAAIRERLAALGKHEPERIPHGTYGYTNWACRCGVCTAANTAKSAAYYNKRRSA